MSLKRAYKYLYVSVIRFCETCGHDKSSPYKSDIINFNTRVCLLLNAAPPYTEPTTLTNAWVTLVNVNRKQYHTLTC